MISPMAEALISFPVEISLKDAVSATLETNWTTLCTMVLENRLMSVMRFQKGDVRSLPCSVPSMPLFLTQDGSSMTLASRKPSPSHEPVQEYLEASLVAFDIARALSCTALVLTHDPCMTWPSSDRP